MKSIITPSCGFTCPSPECPIDCTHRAIANRLQEATDNALDVSFSGNCWLETDKESMGHLYTATQRVVDDDNVLFLDDRGPDSLEVQLVKELRRVGEFYAGLAEMVESKIQMCQS